MASEVDYKVLLGSYQQKSFDLLNQVIALEARVSSSNQIIEGLNKRVQDLIVELEKAKSVIAELKIAEMERLEQEEQKLLEDVEPEMQFGLVSMPPKKKVKKAVTTENSESIEDTKPNEGEL